MDHMTPQVGETPLIAIFRADMGGEQVNAVDARELHRKLGSKQEFAHWVKSRIADNQFVQGLDYEVFEDRIKNPVGGRPRIDYWLTLDAAKHVAMLERNEQGKTIRQYFIEFEKKAREELAGTPALMRIVSKAIESAILPLRQEVQQVTQLAQELKPRADVYDLVLADKEMSVVEFGRYLEGVNLQRLRSSLLHLKYFYQDPKGIMRVYGPFRDVLFSEKVCKETGYVVLKTEYAGIIEKRDYWLTLDAAKHVTTKDFHDGVKNSRQSFGF